MALLVSWAVDGRPGGCLCGIAEFELGGLLHLPVERRELDGFPSTGASGITGILDGEGAAIRRANGRSTPPPPRGPPHVARAELFCPRQQTVIDR